jgi:hypothetical protein
MHDLTAASGARLAALWALCLMLNGCAAGAPEVFVFADAGKYQYHNCEQLAVALKAQSARARDLKELMDKAEQSAGGAFVSFMAYRADYAAVTEDLRVLDATARAKNCRTPGSWQSNSVIQ